MTSAGLNEASGNTLKTSNSIQSDASQSKEVIGSLGSYLAKAREAANMTPADMAARLHLNIKHVLALEAENFENLPASTFIRGYLRGYARVLNLSEESLMNAYERSAHQAGQVTTQPALKQVGRITTVSPPRSYIVPVRHIPWVWIGGGLAVILLLILLYPLVGKLFTAQDPAPVATEKKAKEPAPGDGSLELTLPPPPPASNSPRSSIDSPPSGGIAADRSYRAAATPVYTAATVPGKIRIAYSGKPWAEMKDAQGKNLYAGTGKAGSSTEMEGMPPFAITLGYSPAITLEYNGRPVDTAAYKRNGTFHYQIG